MVESTTEYRACNQQTVPEATSRHSRRPASRGRWKATAFAAEHSRKSARSHPYPVISTLKAKPTARAIGRDGGCVRGRRN